MVIGMPAWVDIHFDVGVGGGVDGCMVDVGFQRSPNGAGAEDQGEAGGWGFLGTADVLEEAFDAHETTEVDDAAFGEDIGVGG